MVSTTKAVTTHPNTRRAAAKAGGNNTATTTGRERKGRRGASPAAGQQQHARGTTARPPPWPVLPALTGMQACAVGVAAAVESDALPPHEGCGRGGAGRRRATERTRTYTSTRARTLTYTHTHKGKKEIMRSTRELGGLKRGAGVGGARAAERRRQRGRATRRGGGSRTNRRGQGAKGCGGTHYGQHKPGRHRAVVAGWGCVVLYSRGSSHCVVPSGLIK